MLFVIDGAAALRQALRETWGDLAVVQRCQLHKLRNVLEHLPEATRPRIRKAIADAYELESAKLAQRRLEQLARALEREHPSAARSLREGLDETLALQRLGIQGALWKTLRSTNPIENLNSSIVNGRHLLRVKRTPSFAHLPSGSSCFWSGRRGSIPRRPDGLHPAARAVAAARSSSRSR
jgi:transposase-like protein